MIDARAKLESGMRHHQSGNFPAAERHYRAVLKSQPRNTNALYLLGMLALDAGRPDLAVVHISKAAKADRKNAAHRIGLGCAYRAMGKPAEAMACFRKAVAIDAKSAPAQLNLATALHGENRLSEAIRHYRRALALAPNMAEAHNNLGVALTKQGKRAEAAERFRRALEIEPNYADAHLNLGQELKAEGNLAEAAAEYRRALALDPKLVEAHNNLGNVLREAGRAGDALAHFRNGLELSPDNPDLHNNLGVAFADLGRIDEALAAHRKALEIDPHDADAHAGLGAALHVLGRIDDAVRHYQAALENRPDHARAHHNIAMAGKGDSQEEHIARLRSLLARPGIAAKDAVALGFALGKLCDDAGRHDDAWAHYAQANAMKKAELARQGRNFDPARHRRFVDRLIAVFDRAFFAARRDFGEASDLPVFIVGMPRSGTTLVEQILASHSRVFGAGELDHIGHLAESGGAELTPPLDYPDSAARLDRDGVRRLGQSYLERLRALAPDAARISDKLPANFLHLGLIALLLPGARIIHCRRDPLDTCLSCYFQSFRGTLPFAYDLADLGHYYEDYQRLMAHWRAVLPLPSIEIDYARLVNEQETVSREIVGFCGLEWEDACLRFHETERPVRTASLTQVRQPIYRSSLGRWRSYERQLGPLKSLLDS